MGLPGNKRCTPVVIYSLGSIGRLHGRSIRSPVKPIQFALRGVETRLYGVPSYHREGDSSFVRNPFHRLVERLVHGDHDSVGEDALLASPRSWIVCVFSHRDICLIVFTRDQLKRSFNSQSKWCANSAYTSSIRLNIYKIERVLNPFNLPCSGLRVS